MTLETLKKANEITEKIEQLKKHKNTILTFGDEEADYHSSKARVFVECAQSSDKLLLFQEYLPFTLPDIIELYISEVSKKITLLEAQLGSL